MKKFTNFPKYEFCEIGICCNVIRIFAISIFLKGILALHSQIGFYNRRKFIWQGVPIITLAWLAARCVYVWLDVEKTPLFMHGVATAHQATPPAHEHRRLAFLVRRQMPERRSRPFSVVWQAQNQDFFIKFSARRYLDNIPLAGEVIFLFFSPL